MDLEQRASGRALELNVSKGHLVSSPVAALKVRGHLLEAKKGLLISVRASTSLKVVI